MYPWLNATFEQLVQRYQARRLHHALLLQGPKGIGKNDFARQLSAHLLCGQLYNNQACGQCQACLLYAAGNHPDFHEVLSDKQIGVDQIRDAIKKLSGSAQLSGAKVVIIYAAHDMTEASANALLKTLEEPSANTYLMLLSHKPERLLPTIISRCERVVLPQPSLAQTMSWLEAQGQQGIAADFVAMYASSPLTLLSELQLQDGLNYQQFSDKLQALLRGELNPSQLAADWQEHAEKLVNWLQHWLYAQIKQQGELSQSHWQLHQLALQAIKHLRNPGSNKVLVLNELLSQISGLIATRS